MRNWRSISSFEPSPTARSKTCSASRPSCAAKPSWKRCACTNWPTSSSALEAERQVFDYELKLPDLNERWLQVNAAVITNSAGEREGTILVFHDLTRLKQLERTREEFVANVSHELRTPLSLIKGYVETLLDGARNNPAVAERFLKIIERNAQRLDLLIQDLLTISALESEKIKLNLQPVGLRPLAEKVFTDLKPPRRTTKPCSSPTTCPN